MKRYPRRVYWRFGILLVCVIALPLVIHGVRDRPGTPAGPLLKPTEDSLAGPATLPRLPTHIERYSPSSSEQLVNRALKAGKPDLGKLYALNAINRSPGDVLAIEAYVNLVNRSDNIEELDRAINIAEMAVFYVKPEQVEWTIALRSTLANRRATLLAAIDKQRKPVDWSERVVALEKVDLDEVLASSERMDAHLEDLSEVRSALGGSRSASEVELAARVQRRIERCLNLQLVRHTLDYIRNCCDRLHGEKDMLSESASSIASAADVAMAQLWGVPQADLTPALVEQVTQVTAMLKAEVDRIMLARSNDILQKIEECAALDPPADFEKRALGKETRKLKWIQSQIQRVGALSTALPSPSVSNRGSTELQLTMAKINARTKDLFRELQEAQQAQYDSYQKWAILVMRDASAKCEDTHWALRKPVPSFDSNDEVARNIYIKTEMVTIDPALLSPEVSAIYADVRGRLFSHMVPASTVWMNDKTHSEKRPLELQ